MGGGRPAPNNLGRPPAENLPVKKESTSGPGRSRKGQEVKKTEWEWSWKIASNFYSEVYEFKGVEIPR